MPPIRSPRQIYLITGMTRNLDDADVIIDNLPAGNEPKTTEQVYAKMKEAVGDWLGLVPLAYNDPIFTGQFKPGGLNAGYKFRRRIGGFKVASYKLIPKDSFIISEIVYVPATKSYITVLGNFASMSIGFPTGHTVTSFITFLESTGKVGEIASVITPAGIKIPLGPVTL